VFFLRGATLKSNAIGWTLSSLTARLRRLANWRKRLRILVFMVGLIRRKTISRELNLGVRWAKIFRNWAGSVDGLILKRGEK
jgi:hypothetical protein